MRPRRCWPSLGVQMADAVTQREKQADMEREFIARGYRIKYRRPEVCCGDPPTHDVWVYQFERGDWTGGLRINDEMMQFLEPEYVVTKWERDLGI